MTKIDVKGAKGCEQRGLESLRNQDLPCLLISLGPRSDGVKSILAFYELNPWLELFWLLTPR